MIPLSTSSIKAGCALVYNDGRNGHQNVACEVLSVSRQSMTVQFEDRADTTEIDFNDAQWMHFLSLIPSPVAVRDITGYISEMDALGIDPLDYANDAAKLFVSEWVDRKGWYELEIKSGLYYATVANDTNEFQTAVMAQAWLWVRVEVTA